MKIDNFMFGNSFLTIFFHTSQIHFWNRSCMQDLHFGNPEQKRMAPTSFFRSREGSGRSHMVLCRSQATPGPETQRNPSEPSPTILEPKPHRVSTDGGSMPPNYLRPPMSRSCLDDYICLVRNCTIFCQRARYAGTPGSSRRWLWRLR